MTPVHSLTRPAPIQDIVPIVCRRFGLRSPTDWVLLREDGAFLAYEHSLLEYGLEPGCKLRLAPLPPELLHKKVPQSLLLWGWWWKVRRV